MVRLLTLDEKNYTDDMPVYEKFAVRAVIIRDGKVAMQKSKKGYFKLLGGGVDAGEPYAETQAREVQEEAGLLIIEDSIIEAGEIVELREDLYKKGQKYVCHSLFYFCDAKEQMVDTNLTASEIREGFELDWASPEEIIEINAKCIDKPWVDRDTCFIRMLAEGKFGR